MPCFDKKLEATRDDFYSDTLGHDVDSVLTTVEVLELLEGTDWDAIPEQEFDPFEQQFSKLDENCEHAVGSPGGSGGVLEFVFRAAAAALFGESELASPLEFKVKRNKDFKEVKLERDGNTLLSFASAYGFRNIQNLVRNLKRGKGSEYHFVEVMACPGGCINGGGQIPADKGDLTPQQLAEKVSDVFNAEPILSPTQDQRVDDIYRQMFDGTSPYSELAKQLLHTQYHKRDALSSTNVEW